MFKFSSILFLFLTMSATQDFKSKQMEFKRVKIAYQDKETKMIRLLDSKNLSISHLHLFIRAFKKEKQLEVWAKNDYDTTFDLLLTYSFCESSGNLGPKRKTGDYQTPEGVYYIDRFNPVSNFYLSLGINYPNSADRILGEKSNLGGDIFIHGNCVTVGCIPLTDDKIKELYLLCIEAANNGQSKIQVHIFPFKLSDQHLKDYAGNTNYAFWKELQPIYTYFEQQHKLPKTSIKPNGQYRLAQ